MRKIILKYCVLLTAIVYFQSSNAATSNLLLNGGFEEWEFIGFQSTPRYWTANCYVWADETPHQGLYNLKIENPDGDCGYVFQEVPVISGEKYVILFWAYAESSKFPGSVNIFWKDYNHQTISLETIEVANTGGYKNFFKYALKAPLDALYAKIGLYVESPGIGSGRFFKIDDIFFGVCIVNDDLKKPVHY
jgi:hypothetical protein